MIAAIIALGCVTVFGVVGIISAFVRQLSLSREKCLNDLAQQRALQHELLSLETLRQEMSHYKRVEVHYPILGVNKDTIQYVDKRIEELLKLYSRHHQNSQERAGNSIDAGTSTFKAVLLAPLYLLMRFFKLPASIHRDKMQEEKSAQYDIFEYPLSLNRIKNPTASGDGTIFLSHKKHSLFANKTKSHAAVDNTDCSFHLNSECIF